MRRRKKAAACWRQSRLTVAPRSGSPIRWAKCVNRSGRRSRSVELKNEWFQAESRAKRPVGAGVVAEFAAVFVCERRLTDFSAGPRVVIIYFSGEGGCV